MTTLSRSEFLGSQVHQPTPFRLPDGNTVLLRAPTCAVYREFRRALRGNDGIVDTTRAPYQDELLVATMLVDEHGNRMFSTQDVLEGVFDNVHTGNRIQPIAAKCWEMINEAEAADDEDRRKNSSTTDSTEL